MNLVPLWDSLAAAVESTPPDDRRTLFDARERLADVTERMIAAAMAEYQQIAALNESQPWYAKPQDPLCRRVGTVVREMFRAWTVHVEEVEARARRSSELTLRPVMAHLGALLHEQGRMLAMLTISYEGLDEAIAEESRGKGYSMEHMRALVKEGREAERKAKLEELAKLKEQVA